MEDVARAAGRVSTRHRESGIEHARLGGAEAPQRVHEAIAKLGYRPNVFAQGLTTKRSHLLGILLPDIHGEFYSELLRGADAEARRLGLITCSWGARGGTGTCRCSRRTSFGFIAGLPRMIITEPNESLWKRRRTGRGCRWW